MIKYSFEQYYRPYSNTQVRKFDLILINEVPYIDENLKIVYSDGFYEELLNNKEINYENDKNKDANIDMREANQSLDIDDFEVDEDIDYSMEVLDNDNE
jgi:D-ribose pyranose/furanose isomerase RbsD